MTSPAHRLQNINVFKYQFDGSWLLSQIKMFMCLPYTLYSNRMIGSMMTFKPTQSEEHLKDKNNYNAMKTQINIYLIYIYIYYFFYLVI